MNGGFLFKEVLRCLVHGKCEGKEKNMMDSIFPHLVAMEREEKK